MTHANPINDVLLRLGVEGTRQIDLKAAFGEEYVTFAVTSSDGTAITTEIDANGVLTVAGTGVIGFADLVVTATDGNGNAVVDNFRARMAGENAFTIAVLPDTQTYTSNPSLNHIFGDMTQWLVDNAESRGIQFVTHVGDITDNNVAAQWDVAEAALRKMDGKLAYSVLPGNHDQAAGGSAADHSTDFLDSRFSPGKQAEANPDTFGGTYDREPERGANTYHTFTAPDGGKWLMLSLEFAPRDDVVRWAADVVEQHLDHRVILSTHNYTSYSGRNDELPEYGGGPGTDYGLRNDTQGYNSGEDLWRDFVSKYPNVAMTLSGHIVIGDGAETQVNYSQHGNPVVQMLVNYQGGVTEEISGGNGGNGAIRLLTFDPDNDAIYTETYFVNKDEYLTGHRGKEELDRDGLTGPYRDHQETISDIALGPIDPRAQAKAGADLFVDAAEGAETAAVQLDGTGSLNTDLAASYAWLDAEGQVIATGIAPTVELAAGQHRLTLQVTDSEGRVTADRKLVVVSDDNTLLVDNFNDGNANGWSTALGQKLVDQTRFAKTSELGLPAMEGGDADVMAFPALQVKGPGYLVKPGIPGQDGGTINNYTIAFDVLVPADNGSWFPFYQTDPNNADDGELFVNRGRLNDGQWNGLGNAGSYHGNFTYDEWHRVVMVVRDADQPEVRLEKYIDGEHVGTTVLSNPSSTYDYRINPDTGFILFNDNTANATSKGYVSSIMLTDKVMSHEEVAALGGANAAGILTETPEGSNAFQLDFSPDAPFAPTLGEDGGLSLINDTEGSMGSWVVKGTHAAPGADADPTIVTEGEVYNSSDAANQNLLWNDNAAREWKDYTFEATMKPVDIDIVGLSFYHQDANNQYRLELNTRANQWSLVKIDDGVRTVLALTEKNATYFDEVSDLRVSVSGNKIQAFHNDKSLFGTVIDYTPLEGGTIGLYADRQLGVTFDNVVVTKTALTAHAENDGRAVDHDNNGKGWVSLSADDSFGPDTIVSYRWLVDGQEIARGADVQVELPVGTGFVTLVVTDRNGETATDFTRVDILSAATLLMTDDFAADSLQAGTWTVVDQNGSIGTSDWQVRDGTLIQLSDIASEQLIRIGWGDENVWNKAWSPLGDGVNVLRKGTIALYGDEEAKDWSNYSIEATLHTTDPDADNGIGFVFYYQDEDNYYKFEMDNQLRDEMGGSYSNGSMWNLVSVKDGIEKLIDRNYGQYIANSEMHLRVDIDDHKIQVYVDGNAVFADPIEDRKLDGGTFGLYTWDVAGVRFDDVRVVSLDDVPAGPVNPDLTYYQDGSGTPQGGSVAGPQADAALVAELIATSVANGHTLIENTGVWNAVKAAVLDHYQAAWGTEFTVANFVDARLDLSFALNQVDVTVVGAKRGQLNGGAFDDQLTWIAHSNESTWSNAVSIDAGAGNDVIEVRAVSSSTLDDALLADNAAPRNGTHWSADYRGTGTTVHIDAGDGNDVIRGFDEVRLIARGGAGDDVAFAGTNAMDVWVLSGNQGDYEIAESNGTWTIRDMVGADGTDTITGFEYLRYGNDTTVAIDTGFAIA